MSPSNDFERLWSPHRMNYISTPHGSENNTFTELPLLSDEESYIVARGENVYVVLNLYPYNPGHCMVVPYRRTSNVEDLSLAEAHELIEYTQKIVRVIKNVAHPHAFNIGFNLGKGAGGSIVEHVHQHVVPRWIGDSSFITVLSNTKVMPELLGQTRSLLAAAWEELC